MDLREDLDVAGEREHRPRRLAEHDARDVVRIRQHAVARRHAFGGQRLDAAEQLLVLELLVAEAHERFERDLVAEPVVAADLEDLGVDEALDEPEQVRVRSALDLAHEAPLGRA